MSAPRAADEEHVGRRAAPLLPPLLSGDPQEAFHEYMTELLAAEREGERHNSQTRAVAATARAAERRCRERVAAIDVFAIINAAPRRGLRDAGEAVRDAVLAALGEPQ